MALKRVTDAQPSLQLPASVSRRAWTLVMKLVGASFGETAPSADLGGNSRYSNENFED